MSSLPEDAKLKELREKLTKIRVKKEEFVREHQYEWAAKLRDEERVVIDEILFIEEFKGRSES